MIWGTILFMNFRTSTCVQQTLRNSPTSPLKYNKLWKRLLVAYSLKARWLGKAAKEAWFSRPFFIAFILSQTAKEDWFSKKNSIAFFPVLLSSIIFSFDPSSQILLHLLLFVLYLNHPASSLYKERNKECIIMWLFDLAVSDTSTSIFVPISCVYKWQVYLESKLREVGSLGHHNIFVSFMEACAP